MNLKLLRTITCFFLLSLLFSCGSSTDKFAKTWTATDVILNGTPFKAEALGSFVFNFKSDGTFDYIENGSSETGTWSASDDGKTITLKYANREVKQTVVKQEGNTLVLDYNDHGMQRVVTLSSK